jgi:hypothetical protein
VRPSRLHSRPAWKPLRAPTQLSAQAGHARSQIPAVRGQVIVHGEYPECPGWAPCSILTMAAHHHMLMNGEFLFAACRACPRQCACTSARRACSSRGWPDRRLRRGLSDGHDRRGTVYEIPDSFSLSCERFSYLHQLSRLPGARTVRNRIALAIICHSGSVETGRAEDDNRQHKHHASDQGWDRPR